MQINSKTSRLLAQLQPQSKSLLMTIFGDTIVARGGCVSIASLIATAAIFNISASNVRISMLRLMKEGWVESRRRGRYSDYLLSDSCHEQFEQAHDRIYAVNRVRGDEQWRLLLPGKLSSTAFRRLAHRLRWSGFAAAGSGVLIKPGNHTADSLLDELGVAGQVVMFTATAVNSPAMAQLVADSWDLKSVNTHYQQFDKNINAMQAIITAETSTADAFVLRTLLIHEYRRVLLHDPMLPPSLLPPKWHGEQARAHCAQLYKKLTPAADAFVATYLSVNKQPLPPPADFYYQRFGGLAKGKK